ncbi:3-keto-disaccharide hydrolase [Ramlibacter alkalitolerans]|jgi:hypothetical protein|uniref:DUF1080 domain-containing protein n=1 Tax=Ramlibacter alkalitolerans TaxID=2039631 RepID=A0ABS1JLH7_9BURK|nr:DUF1080 domain-containing protein [Ramlibacter alkalitolerans]MBL0425082.1 DUF1080 domain-containing protein [Ramlibacter alkalitolerans]
MNTRTVAALAAAALAATLGGCAQMQSMMPGSGWTTLIDGTRGMENFRRVGEANWTATDGAIQATAGGKDPAYLLTNNSYRDFMLRAEFWASDDANSGIYFRCQNPQVVNDENCYEANIFDQRPDPSYATGSIVKVAKVPANFQRAGGKWNTYEITARGDHLVVVLNGQKTIDIREDARRFASGPIGLQWGRGTIKWRKVEVKPL